VHAKQMLYNFSQTSSTFHFGYFGNGGLMNYLLGMALNHDPPNLSLPSS
jgi:hypothetical protein